VQEVAAIHAFGKSLTRRLDGVRHKLYMDNCFSSLDVFNDLHTRHIYCCGTTRQSHEGMIGDFDNKIL
jgi:hypothetical protein